MGLLVLKRTEVIFKKYMQRLRSLSKVNICYFLIWVKQLSALVIYLLNCGRGASLMNHNMGGGSGHKQLKTYRILKLFSPGLFTHSKSSLSFLNDC